MLKYMLSARFCFFFSDGVEGVDSNGYPPSTFDHEHLPPPPLTPLQPSNTNGFYEEQARSRNAYERSQDDVGPETGGHRLETSHDASANDAAQRPNAQDISIMNDMTSSSRDGDVNSRTAAAGGTSDASPHAGATQLHPTHRHSHLGNLRSHPYHHSHHPLPSHHLTHNNNNLYSRQNLVINGPPSPRLTPSPPHSNSQRFVYPPPNPYSDVTSLRLNG